ncbi:hypothetical protein C8J56DRAFT_1052848 [Mycena floridula]|nr:hypothetical protein C8J56DRAFT_1052848 [Mycena floridula]
MSIIGPTPEHHVVFCRFRDRPASASTRNTSEPWLVMSTIAGRPRTAPAHRPLIYAKFPVDPVMVTYRPVVMFLRARECIYDVETNILLVMPDIIIEEGGHKVYSVIADEGMLVG